MEKAAPILTALREVMEERAPQAPPESLIGKALNYTLKQWPKLIRYLDDPRLEIGRVEMWRGKLPPVSTPRSSNRTCATNASGFRTKYHAFALGTSAITFATS